MISKEYIRSAIASQKSSATLYAEARFYLSIAVMEKDPHERRNLEIQAAIIQDEAWREAWHGRHDMEITPWENFQ